MKNDFSRMPYYVETPLREIDNEEFRQIKSDIEEINEARCLSISENKIIELTYYLYCKNYKRQDPLAEYYARHPQATFSPWDDLVYTRKYDNENFHNANFDMALPKDFKTRFNNEITVLSTGELPNALKPNDLKEK